MTDWAVIDSGFPARNAASGSFEDVVEAVAGLVGAARPASGVEPACAVVAQAFAHAVGTPHVEVLVLKQHEDASSRRGDAAGLAQLCNDRQLVLGQGPLVDCLRDQSIVMTTDVSATDRWPQWQLWADIWGLEGVLVVPLELPDHRWGVITLYFETGTRLGDSFLPVVKALAAVASTVLDGAMRAENFRRALASRTQIGQAQGVLMERHGIDANLSFSVLRRWSQHRNVRLARVAAGVIDGTVVTDVTEVDTARTGPKLVTLQSPRSEAAPS